MKLILLFGFLAYFTVLTIGATDDDNFKCVPGVAYVENECNNCFCGGSALACTEMACMPNSRLTDCQIGTTWYKGCDQCWCTKTGTICTKDCGKVRNV